MISRRRFLTGVATALAPMGAAAHAQEYKAQQATKVYRIAVFQVIPPAQNEHVLKALEERLRERGYVPGQNIFIGRCSNGRTWTSPSASCTSSAR